MYWLSDAVISLTLKCPMSLKDIAGKNVVDNELPYGPEEIPKDLCMFLEKK